MTRTVVFTCAGDGSGWSVLRSLERAGGYRLVAVDADPFAAGVYERCVSAGYRVPLGTAPDYVEHMQRICEKEKADVVFPCSDEEVLAVAQQRSGFLDIGTLPLVSPPDVVAAAMDKPSMVAHVAGLGVPVPLTLGLSDVGRDFPFPVIVRPRRGRGARGVRFFEHFEAFDAFRDEIGVDEASTLFVQERLDVGVGHMHMTCGVFDGRGGLKAFFSSRSLRTAHDWGGPSRGGIPVRDPVLTRLARTVLENSGAWLGPVCAEFLYVPSRRAYVFVEINPRIWGYSFLATAAGLNFPDIAVRVAMGEDIPFSDAYRTDVVTMTTSEHVSVPLSSLTGPLPTVELP